MDAIITIDERGIIDDVNPATERLFGYAAHEMIGQNVKMLMPSPYRDEHDQYLANYLRTGEARIIGIGREVVARSKDGATFPVDLAVSQFQDQGGLRFTGIVRDVRQRKNLEKHLADARFDEQRRIAHELHDGLGGQLTGIGMLAKAIQIQLERDQSSCASQVANLVSHVRAAHEQLRKLSHGLQPVDVAPEGLERSLQDLAARTASSGQVDCRMNATGHTGVNSQVHATHLYRIAQEAISNAVRHAQATHVTIGLEGDGDRLLLTIRDNGMGIRGSSDRRDGMGLKTMAHRASQIGATFAVKPADGGGTLVTCTYFNGRSA